jgi:hypothetical protein
VGKLVFEKLGRCRNARGQKMELLLGRSCDGYQKEGVCCVILVRLVNVLLNYVPFEPHMCHD